jgi:diguanylate cyclase (GGDEF)-like protein/PAS domain S-box-containing protein
LFDDESSAALQRSDRRFHLVAESIEDYAICALDPLGHILTWNHGAELITRYEAIEVLGRHFRMFFVPDDVTAKSPEAVLAEAASYGRCPEEGWRLRKNGEQFWASSVIGAIRDESGILMGFTQVVRDLSEIKRQQDALRALERTLREDRDCLYLAAECSMDAVYVCRAYRGLTGEIEDFVFTYLNGNVEKMVSIPRSVLLGGRMCDLFPVNRTSGLFEKYKRVALTGEPLVQEVPFEENTINASWIRMQVVRVGDGIAITASDITPRKREEERILHLAQHDNLTGLPNRSLLSDRISQAIERARRFSGKVAVFLVDLDGFKKINDTLGHAIGDAVLVTVAVRLKAAVRATDSVIRLGGDEFVVVMPDIVEQRDIVECARKILNSLESCMDVEGHSIQSSCSVGLAVYPDSAETVEQLLLRADTAMYSAKADGKNRYSAAPVTFHDGNFGDLRSGSGEQLDAGSVRTGRVAVLRSRPME